MQAKYFCKGMTPHYHCYYNCILLGQLLSVCPITPKLKLTHKLKI